MDKLSVIKNSLDWRIRYLKSLRYYFYWSIKRYLHNCSNIFIKNDNKISIVVVGRNDNYGGNFSRRLEVTLDWNLSKIPVSELIYVEWNNIPERESDCEWITKKYPNSRCYIVSNEIHKKISTNPNIPLLEYHAKNVGIRRAKYDWILLVNADVFLGLDVINNLKRLNKKYVYGSHYINIEWNGEDITEKHLVNNIHAKSYCPANEKMENVVGNFILTHKDNWLKMTGYDERLTNVRIGVDRNGLCQLLYNGCKPMIIGHHYHLDHKESALYGWNVTHGNEQIGNNIPYKNEDNWGLMNYKEVEIKERIWLLKEI